MNGEIHYAYRNNILLCVFLELLLFYLMLRKNYMYTYARLKCQNLLKMSEIVNSLKTGLQIEVMVLGDCIYSRNSEFCSKRHFLLLLFADVRVHKTRAYNSRSHSQLEVKIISINWG